VIFVNSIYPLIVELFGKKNMVFNRADAGRKLADVIPFRWDKQDVIVVGIPRGGVVVANEMARKFELPLELILVKKIAHPLNEEVAIGAVSANSILLENKQDYDHHWLTLEIERKRFRIGEMKELFQVQPIPKVQHKIVILVDDGVATGFTLLHAIDLLRQQLPREIIVAVPVCPKELVSIIETKVDAFYCLEIPSVFHSIGQFYQRFDQVEDEEVNSILDENKKARHNRA
jgi:putative phosphoribosyl transferase